MSKKPGERYPLERSPFYRMGRAVDLASLLLIDPKTLRRLLVQRSALYNHRTEQIDQKVRHLSIPIGDMRSIHDRLKDLLGRVELPDYLYSPRRGRSAHDNAKIHVGSASIAKLDVRQFYPSTTSEHVFQFLRHRLRMADDVAGRLTKLCTVNGRVPFGSPLSPVLCALVHDDVFGAIQKQAAAGGNKMSLWVDDLTLSGERVPPSLLHDARRLIAAKGLRTHKSEKVRQRRGMVVTGTFISKGNAVPSNKSHLRTKGKLALLNGNASVIEKYQATLSLMGLAQHQLTILPADSPVRRRVEGRLMWLHTKKREFGHKLEGAGSDVERESATPIANEPW